MRRENWEERNEGQPGGKAKCVLFLLHQLVGLVGRIGGRVVANQEAQREKCVTRCVNALWLELSCRSTIVSSTCRMHSQGRDLGAETDADREFKIPVSNPQAGCPRRSALFNAGFQTCERVLR